MECIYFIGIPASGKSSFYKEFFFNSHIRISLDLLKTRNKESLLIDYCLKTQSKMVIDNTNVDLNERARYLSRIKDKKYTIIAYYFHSELEDALFRNNLRKEKINEIGIKAKFKQLIKPTLEEGFEKIYYVTLNKGTFNIREDEN